MENRLKFRVWNPRYKEFSFWGFMDNHFKGPPTGSQLSINDCSESDRLTPFVDAKGNPIYESDIIEFTLEDGTKERGTVRFADGGFWTTQDEGHSEELLSDELDYERLEATIVGHIYQQPDAK